MTNSVNRPVLNVIEIYSDKEISGSLNSTIGSSIIVVNNLYLKFELFSFNWKRKCHIKGRILISYNFIYNNKDIEKKQEHFGKFLKSNIVENC